MNTPIINPLWIYLCNVIPNIGGLCIAFGAMSFIVALVTFFVKADGCLEDSAEVTCTKIIKSSVIIFIASCIIAVITPDRETMQAMMIANYVTPANIESVGEGAKDVVDYIFDKINEAEDKKNE